jgi:hypothetical protein
LDNPQLNLKSRLGCNILIFHPSHKGSFCVEISAASGLAQINLHPQSLSEFAAVLIQSMVWRLLDEISQYWHCCCARPHALDWNLHDGRAAYMRVEYFMAYCLFRGKRSTTCFNTCRINLRGFQIFDFHERQN